MRGTGGPDDTVARGVLTVVAVLFLGVASFVFIPSHDPAAVLVVLVAP